MGSDDIDESTPLLPKGPGGPETGPPPASISSTAHHKRFALSALSGIVVVCVALLGVATVLRHRFAQAPRYFVGVPNWEGFSAQLVHFGCYAKQAQMSGRTLVVVPQYEGVNYPDIPAGQPTMDWDELFDPSAFAALNVNYVPYARVPPEALQVLENTDSCLMGNIRSRDEVVYFKKGAGVPMKDVSDQRWAQVEAQRGSLFEVHRAQLAARAADPAVCSMTRGGGCGQLPLIPAPKINGLFNDAMHALGMGDGRYAAIHWRRGDKCGDSGGGERCENAYNHPALEYCKSRSENGALPWYIASDETDANILAHWKSR